MDTTLNADARAALLLKAMTEDEKFQMLHSYFGLGKDGGPLPEGAVGSAGFVPGVARLGIPSQQSADAGVGVTNPGGIRPGDFATAMPSGPSTASSWNREVALPVARRWAARHGSSASTSCCRAASTCSATRATAAISNTPVKIRCWPARWLAR
jgi:beta-glucosidase-like glycosyl hydrolase